METDRGTGPLALVCTEGENPVKFTMYDSDARVTSTITACIGEGMPLPDILHLLSLAGYVPNDWDDA